jgi:hypothetical protein
MSTHRSSTPRVAALLTATLLAACGDEPPMAPDVAPVQAMQRAEANRALATLRRATARYHNLDAALEDGFILLHECEVRPGEGAVGLLYIHLDRYLDGVVDPSLPDGLLYAPRPNGPPRLAGVELALPMAMWNAPAPPEFLGVPFQAEDEFAAFGLHIWLWQHNPDGLFAQAHPGISCGPEA